MHVTESTLKLYYKCLIRKIQREVTFDEREKMQAWLDSAMFSNYASNLSKVMTEEAREFIEEVRMIIGGKNVSGWKQFKQLIIKNVDDFEWYELTDKGHKLLTRERVRMLRVYNEMKKEHTSDPEKFYEKSSQYESYIPMMLVMGLHGFVFGALAGSAAHTACAAGMDSMHGYESSGEFQEFGIGM